MKPPHAAVIESNLHPHLPSSGCSSGAWWWMKVETAFCFRRWCLLMWVVPPELSPKADKSELLVSVEDIGLPYKAQGPVCGVLHEIHCWDVFRVHWLVWALHETFVLGFLVWSSHSAEHERGQHVWDGGECGLHRSPGMLRFDSEVPNEFGKYQAWLQVPQTVWAFILLFPPQTPASFIVSSNSNFDCRPQILFPSTLGPYLFPIFSPSIPLQPLFITSTFYLSVVLPFQVFVKV